MDDPLEQATPEEIAQGTTEFFEFMEECDSLMCNYTWQAILDGSVILYDFRKVDHE